MQRKLSPSVKLIVGVLALAYLVAPSASTAQSDPDQQEKLMHYSLYYEDYKNKNYESALPSLLWILEKAPAFPRNKDTNFDRAVDVYAGIALKQEDDASRRAWMDSALAVFDVAVPRLTELGAEVDPFEWQLDLGKFLFEHREVLPEKEPEIATAYRGAWDMEPSRLDAYYLEYILADLVQNEDKAGAVEFLDEIEENRGEEEAVIALLAKWRNALFTDPTERYDFIKVQLEKSPDDADLLKELFELAMELEYRDEVYELADRVLAMEKDAKTVRLLAKMKLDDGDAAEAYAMYEEALSMAETPDDQRDIYYNMGIAQQQMGRLSRARTSFRKALEVDGQFGAALMAIGDLYVTAVSECGSFEREDRAVYWLVTDYYQRAKNADASLASASDRKIRQYRAYYPDQEALFFKGWNAGDRYTVNYGCYSWIGESTTVKNP